MRAKKGLRICLGHTVVKQRSRDLNLGCQTSGLQYVALC